MSEQNYVQIAISGQTLEQKVTQVGNLANLKTNKKDNLVNAVNEVAEAGNEVVQFSLLPVAGTIDYSNSSVSILVAGEATAKTSSVDSNGQANVLVPIGKSYTVTYPSYLGFSTPQSETYTAALGTRAIVKNYAISGELSDLAGSVVLEESSTPQWTQGGKIEAINEIINTDGSWVIDEVHHKRAKLSPDDGLKFVDGTAWSGLYGNAFRHIVGCYYKFTTNDQNKTLLWLSKRGIDVNQFPDMWIGTYKGNVHDNKLWSQPNRQATGNVSITNFFNYAQAQKTSGYEGSDYGLVNYLDQCYLVALHLAKYGTPDVFGNMGVGLQDAGSSYWTFNTGCTSPLGDGTGEYSCGDGSQNKQNKLFGIEGLTGQQWEFRPNIYANNGTFIIYKGNQCSNAITEGHADYLRSVQQISGSGTYIKTMQLGTNFDVLPKTGGSNSASDWCDAFYANTSGNNVVLFGGRSSGGARCGLGASASDVDFGYASSDCGSRLAFRGDITKYEVVTGAQMAALNA